MHTQKKNDKMFGTIRYGLSVAERKRFDGVRQYLGRWREKFYRNLIKSNQKNITKFDNNMYTNNI